MTARRYRLVVDTPPAATPPVKVTVAYESLPDKESTSDSWRYSMAWTEGVEIISCEALPDPPRLATLEEIRRSLRACHCCISEEIVSLRAHDEGEVLNAHCAEHTQPGDLYLRVPSSGECTEGCPS